MRRLIILIASDDQWLVVRSVLIGEHAQCNPSDKCCCTIATDRSQERRFVVGFLRNNIEGTSSSSSVSQITLDRNAGSAGWLNPARKANPAGLPAASAKADRPAHDNQQAHSEMC